MNSIKTAFFMAALTVLFIVIGSMLGGQTGMVLAFMFAVMMNVGTYWFSDKLVLKAYRAQEIGPGDHPQLYGMVQNLARRANLPMPRVYVIPSAQPNAFATGRNPDHAAVAVTEGIMQMLDRDELAGVIGHELAHIKNRDILIGTIAATLAGAITMLANMAQWALIFGGFGGSDDDEGASPLAMLPMIIIAPIVAMLIQMAVSRSREYIADEEGARIAGNPRWLARALRKLEMGVQRVPADVNPATAHMFIANPLAGRRLATLFSTHPPMEKRIARLEQMR